MRLWSAERFRVIDDLEINSTVRLMHFMEEAQRCDPQYRALFIQLEGPVVTPEMKLGEASVIGAARPDLRVSVGRVGGVSIECKRLRETEKRLCDLYVHQGMGRFVVSRYGAGEPLGLMVGYVQDGSAATLIGPVNQGVTAHPAMGSTGCLTVTATKGDVCWLRSTHNRALDVPIDLRHDAWIDMRNRVLTTKT